MTGTQTWWEKRKKERKKLFSTNIFMEKNFWYEDSPTQLILLQINKIHENWNKDKFLLIPPFQPSNHD